MTNKDALYWCEQFTDNVVISNLKGSKMFLALEAMQQCKNALDKQIPKKPLPEEKVYGNGICPSCGAYFLDKLTKYCGNCGQALDWKKEE